MAFVLEKYLQQIRDATSGPGVYAYRGQSREEWPLQSAATRRLAKSLGNSDLHAPWFSKAYIDYHRETLIGPALTRGFGVENGRDISELQLLAKLQHYGAATGLLDFTWSPLIALWFVCREPDSDGKLIVVNVNDPINVARAPSGMERQTIDAVLSRADNEPGLLYWEPMWSGEAMPRILRQRGVFIVGRPLIPSEGQFIKEITITKEDKRPLLDELALLDINEASMFPDIYGFSSMEGTRASTHVRNPQFYLIQGNQNYQEGNYMQAIAAYDDCIDLSPEVGELHLLRGNAKSEAKLYLEAVDDYRLAIGYRGTPFLGMGPTNRDVLGRVTLSMAHFNCGNVLTELSDYDAALNSYTDALAIDDNGGLGRDYAHFNRGNVHLDLGQFDQAIGDYEAALSLQAPSAIAEGIFFNRGNALVMLGRFEEALECYKLAELRENLSEASINNREALERIMGLIGPNEYEFRIVEGTRAPVQAFVVQVGEAHVPALKEPFTGRVGNAGNFGWHGVRGGGFGGNLGFVLHVIGTEQMNHLP